MSSPKPVRSNTKRARSEKTEEEEKSKEFMSEAASASTSTSTSTSNSNSNSTASEPVVLTTLQKQVHVHRHPGHWLPAPHHLHRWLTDFHKRRRVAAVKAHQLRFGSAPVTEDEAASGKDISSPQETWEPVVQDFYNEILNNALVRLVVTTMVEQGAKADRHPRPKTVEEFMCSINFVIHTAPEYDSTDLVGAPLNAVVDCMMATPAGFAAFRDPTVNKHLRLILNEWGRFLESKKSVYVLNDGPKGWCSKEVGDIMQISDFVHNPSDLHWGFKSWNDFFIRSFKPNVRPVQDPLNEKVIVSACESTPYALVTKAKLRADYWIKGQPYSLIDMVGGNQDLAKRFEGGTVYQAFLSALFYHRWHTPVSGRVELVEIIPGTYYSEAEVEGFDPGGPNLSQGYITNTAARGLVVIDTTGKANIGKVAILFVGMAEISSCVFAKNIIKGHEVKKGDELGWFQYGGSTHCVLFEPGKIKYFTPQAIPQGNFEESTPQVRLSTAIAVAN